MKTAESFTKCHIWIVCEHDDSVEFCFSNTVLGTSVLHYSSRVELCASY